MNRINKAGKTSESDPFSHPLCSVSRHFEKDVDVIQSDPDSNNWPTLANNKYTRKALNTRQSHSVSCKCNTVILHDMSCPTHLRFVQGDNYIDCINLGVSFCLAGFSNWGIKQSQMQKIDLRGLQFVPVSSCRQTVCRRPQQRVFLGGTKARGNFHQGQLCLRCFLSMELVRPLRSGFWHRKLRNKLALCMNGLFHNIWYNLTNTFEF